MTTPAAGGSRRSRDLRVRDTAPLLKLGRFERKSLARRPRLFEGDEMPDPQPSGDGQSLDG